MTVASPDDVAALELLAVELALMRAVSVAENTNGGTIAAVRPGATGRGRPVQVLSPETTNGTTMVPPQGI